MQVGRWGNRLAVRLPAAVVEALGLKEGDEIEIEVAGGAAPARPTQRLARGGAGDAAVARAARAARLPLRPRGGKFPRQGCAGAVRRRFLDTNILVHAVTEGDPRQAPAAALLAEGGTISVQVLNESAAVARRRLCFTWPELRQATDSVRALCGPARPLTAATQDAALDLAGRLGCQFYDTLILASALEAGCDTVLTEDLQHGQRIEGRLTIRTAFLTP